MDKKKLYIIGGILVLFGVSYIIVRSGKRRKLLTEFNKESEDNSIIPQSNQGVVYSDIFPLKLGSGYNSYTVKSMVKNVQRYINIYISQYKSGTQLLIVDGLFGASTENQLYVMMGKKTVSKEYYQKML